MARETFPRKQALHEAQADIVLQKHERVTGRPVALPVPVEEIIEQSMGLSILYDEIEEPPGAMILGALSPSQRTIVLNERHLSFFEDVIGPERFTLAHELGHWVYDAGNPDQQTLDFGAASAEQFCYHRSGSGGLSETERIREVNANGFASCLLMPRHLVVEIDIASVMADFRGTAQRWGVSMQALRIRLERLELIDDHDLAQLDLL